MSTTTTIPIFTDPLTPRSSIDAGHSSQRVSLTLSRTPTHSHPASTASSSPDRPPAPFHEQQQFEEANDYHETETEEEDGGEMHGELEEEEEDDVDRIIEDGKPKASRLLQPNYNEADDDEDEFDLTMSPDPGGSVNGRYNRLGTGSFEGVNKNHHLTKGQRRKVYGGGRHDIESGGMGVGEVAGLIIAGLLSPTPILLPHAAALLGLPIFLAILFIAGALSCFSLIVLGVETRYVGSRSWSSLASAVFPHRLKAHHLGEGLAIVMTSLASLARGIVSLVAASEIATDLLVSSEGSRLKERIIISTVIAITWVLVPSAVLPFYRTFIRRRPSSNSSNSSSQSRYPIYINFFFWPIALLILGVRLKTLNLTLPPPSIPPHYPSKEAMGTSIWGGISILVFSLSAHQDTFTYLTSLARPSSTSTASKMANRKNSAKTLVPTPMDKTEGRRNQWPLATLLGVGAASAIQLGWGLVGCLGIEDGGKEGNLFANPMLKKDDGWLMLVRVMVLIAILVSMNGNLNTVQGRCKKILKGMSKKVEETGASYTRLGGADEERRSTGSWDWRIEMSRGIVWIIVAAAAGGLATIGESGEGLVSMAEVVGCTISSWLGFLAPSLFFIVLFHLRKPRSIFVTDPNAPGFAADTLLMRKEREVQRRLSGRRIWQDVLVFGGLLPFGVLLILRGCLALSIEGY